MNYPVFNTLSLFWIPFFIILSIYMSLLTRDETDFCQLYVLMNIFIIFNEFSVDILDFFI